MYIFRVILVCICLLLSYFIWQFQELKRFNCTHYELFSKKIIDSHCWVMISDLHLWRYGKHHERLVSAIRKECPEAIFFSGDLIVHSKPEYFFVAEELMEQLVKISPVYFSNGNHESRLEHSYHPNHMAYQQLKKRLQKLGVHILNNECMTFYAGSDEMIIHGLELPISYYRKGIETPLDPDELKHYLGVPDTSQYHVLLAHTPKYIPQYFKWGADLSLSGHYHGGLVCLPGIGSIISPQFELFPKYSFGRIDHGEQTALVSRGMGTHTFHIRIFNRSELLVISVKPK